MHIEASRDRKESRVEQLFSNNYYYSKTVGFYFTAQKMLWQQLIRGTPPELKKTVEVGTYLDLGIGIHF
jgi:hypothetical protein